MLCGYYHHHHHPYIYPVSASNVDTVSQPVNGDSSGLQQAGKQIGLRVVSRDGHYLSLTCAQHDQLAPDVHTHSWESEETR